MALSAFSRAGSLQRASSLPLVEPPRVLGLSRCSKCHPAACPAPEPGGRSTLCAAQLDETPAPSARPATSTTDPFVAAGSRLQSLLSRVGDGEEELVNTLVAEEAPEKKIQTSVVLGGAVTVGAIVVATLCGKDPWGGAGFSAASVGAAAIGALASLPMVLLRKWSWSPQGYKLLPSLQDVHEGQLELHRPWLTRMTGSQVSLMMALEVVPLTLLLFPAAQGAITSSLAMYSQLLNNPNLASDSEYLSALALIVTGLISGVGRSLELGVSEEEYDLVNTASHNADRYYRTVAADMNSTRADAARSAEAFRYVAQAWLQTRGEASLLAGVMTAVDIVLLGVLWHCTHDLTAPLVAALAVNGVDFQNLHSAVLKKDAKAAASRRGQ